MDAEHIRRNEDLFYGKVDDIMSRIKDCGTIDIVIGIPFYNEKDTLPDVIKTAAEGLKSYPGEKLILCVGDPAGQEALEAIKDVGCSVPCISVLMEQGINGRGFSIRAIMEVAKRLGADVALLEADLKRKRDWGFKPSWVERLIYPLAEGYDVVLADFRRHYFEDTTGDLFVKPLLESLYGWRISDPLSGTYALSHDVISDFCSEINQWYECAGGYGVNPWLVTRAITGGMSMCEVSLGAKITVPSAGKRSFVFKEVARAVFECLIYDQDYWTHPPAILKRPSVYGLEDRDRPNEVSCRLTDFIQSFQSGYENYRIIFDKILPADMRKQLDELSGLSNKDFTFDEELWARVVYLFLQSYRFNESIPKEDLLDAFTVMYEGRIAGYIKQVRGVDMEELIYKKADDYYTNQVGEMTAGRNSLIKSWKDSKLNREPAITPLDYLEFVPGVPIVLPKKLKGLGGSKINTNDIFKKLMARYKREFNDFCYNMLEIGKDASPSEISGCMKDFMHSAEQSAAEVFNGDLYSEDGTRRFAEAVLGLAPNGKVITLKDNILRRMLYEFPPRELLLRMGFAGVREMLENIGARSALTYASMVEERQYMDDVMLWLKDNLRPDSIGEADIVAFVPSTDIIPNIADMREIVKLNSLTGMIVVRRLGKGMGGDYPHLLYLTHLVKCVAEEEHYTYLWKLYARKRRGFALKAVNALSACRSRDLFSANNMFENWHQRMAAVKLKEISRKLDDMGQKDQSEDFYKMAEGYGLSLTLADGVFVSCTAGTWASYSFRGGKGLPTPLSVHVDRDWFNFDLLEDIYKEMGYRPDKVLDDVCELLGEGKEGVNLINGLLGIKDYRDSLMVQDVGNWPAAGQLIRYEDNPVLRPVPGHWWESRYVLNAAALLIEGRIYLLYRAVGKDGVSRIGLAISDGCHIIERLPDPVFSPGSNREKMGCEDPRAVILDGKIYMMYTAYDGVVAQVAAASISVEDFVNRDFDRWERLGLAFPNLWDKDAILFPGKIDGKYVMYHRIEPSMWVSYSDSLEFPWTQGAHKIIIGPRSGMMWDSLKIGAGSQPLKTRYGWMLIYHGVDDNMIYRLGIILTDLKDPGRLLYRSPNPVLSPQAEYETGDRVSSWVPNVVFTCGAVPEHQKDILDKDDEILVYYGAADTYLCLAHARIGDLLPHKIRKVAAE